MIEEHLILTVAFMGEAFLWEHQMLPDAPTHRFLPPVRYHHDERVNGSRLVVQLLLQHQDAAPGVQVEELGAVLTLPAVDGVHQLAVGVGVLGADLQDVLPGRRVLRNPHLQQQPQLIDGM